MEIVYFPTYFSERNLKNHIKTYCRQSIMQTKKGAIIKKFIIIPFDLLTFKEENVDTPVLIYVYTYLQATTSFFNYSKISLGELLENSGNKYRTTWKESFRMQKIFAALEWLEEKEYISLPEEDWKNFRFNESFKIYFIDAGMPIGSYRPDGSPLIEGRFVKLTVEEAEKIILNNDSKNRPLDLWLYLYIKAHIFPRVKDQTIDEHPMYWHFSQQEFVDMSGSSKPTIIQALSRIENELQLIKSQKPKNIIRGSDGQGNDCSYSNLQTLYVLNQPGWENELKHGFTSYIRYIKGIKEKIKEIKRSL